MPFATRIKEAVLLLCLLGAGPVAHAQRAQSAFSTVEYQDYDQYYERITYIGKRKDVFIVNTYLKDSTLYRIDNYRIIDQGGNAGLYAVRHGATKLFYGDGQLYVTCDYNMNVLNGPFMVYHTDGSIKRRELYRNGNVKKGICYDDDGHEQACTPFYEQVKFTGNEKELTTYLETNLTPLLQETQSFFFVIGLVINQVGQVIDVKIGPGRPDARLTAAIRRVMQEMPRWHENDSNWKPALMDGVPIPGNWGLQLYRERNTYWRITLPQQPAGAPKSGSRL